MEEIDAIRINFSQNNLLALNLCIAFLMFGVALDLKISDFKRVVTFPKALAIGLTSQLLFLPLMTLVLLWFWQPAPSIALGLFLVSVCPGGNISNFAVHYGRGNAALSVTMTSIVTIGAVLITPLSFAFWAGLLPETRELLRTIAIDPIEIFKIMVQLILIPLIAGMLINHHFPGFTGKIRKTVKSMSLLIFASFIIVAVASNHTIITNYLYLVFALVVLHNLLALLGGFSIARIGRLSVRDSKAICMETGIQNAGLGLVLIFNFFSHLGGMMLVAAFWGVWDLVSGFLLSVYWNRTSKNQPDLPG